MKDQMLYIIRVQGQLVPEHWRVWFDGLTFEALPNGDMQLSGLIPDQAALHGILAHIRDLGMTLLYLEGREVKLG